MGISPRSSYFFYETERCRNGSYSRTGGSPLDSMTGAPQVVFPLGLYLCSKKVWRIYGKARTVLLSCNFRRGHPVLLLKTLGKIGGRPEPHFIGNFRNAVAIFQK